MCFLISILCHSTLMHLSLLNQHSASKNVIADFSMKLKIKYAQFTVKELWVHFIAWHIQQHQRLLDVALEQRRRHERDEANEKRQYFSGRFKFQFRSWHFTRVVRTPTRVKLPEPFTFGRLSHGKQ